MKSAEFTVTTNDTNKFAGFIIRQQNLFWWQFFYQTDQSPREQNLINPHTKHGKNMLSTTWTHSEVEY